MGLVAHWELFDCCSFKERKFCWTLFNGTPWMWVMKMKSRLLMNHRFWRCHTGATGTIARWLFFLTLRRFHTRAYLSFFFTSWRPYFLKLFWKHTKGTCVDSMIRKKNRIFVKYNCDFASACKMFLLFDLMRWTWQCIVCEDCKTFHQKYFWVWECWHSVMLLYDRRRLLGLGSSGQSQIAVRSMSNVSTVPRMQKVS